MNTLDSALIGIASGVLASAIFLASMRAMLTPKIGISTSLAHNFNSEGKPVYRIKIVNQRRFSKAVKLSFELVALTPRIASNSTIDGRRRYFIFGKRIPFEASQYKFERDPIVVRPSQLISLERFNRQDRDIGYAFRVTLSDSPEILEALRHDKKYLRFTVYAEHPWSNRAMVFPRRFNTTGDTTDGDFPIGPDLKVVGTVK
jgi:hypothetical protein